MKTIFRALGLAVFIAGVLGISVAAQDANCDIDAINAQYQKVLDTWTKIDTLPTAIAEGKVFLEKFGSCEIAEQNTKWLKGKIPAWEKAVEDEKKNKIVRAFDKAMVDKNYDAAYAAGEEFLSKYPNEPELVSFFEVPLGLIGLDQSIAKNNKYNDSSIKWANLALSDIRAGKTSIVKDKNNNVTPDLYGIYGYQCKKDECISWLTYGLAYINYHVKGDKQKGLSYYYEVSRLPGQYKSNPLVYETIGAYYLATVTSLDKEIKALIDDQDKGTPEEREKRVADIKAKIALWNGYAERMMDAYSRAYTLAKTNPAGKTYADGLYKTLQAVYSARFPVPEGKPSLDSWISSTISKPLPDPTSPVTPVADPETSTGESSAPASSPAKPTATPAGTKPVTNGPIKPGTVKVNGTTGKGPSDSTTAVKTKTPAAKPAPRKKGL
jgi:hypothetical protein